MLFWLRLQMVLQVLWEWLPLVRRTRLFLHVLTHLNCLFQAPSRRMWCMYMYIAASNAKGLQAGSFVTQWYKKHVYSIHFHTNTRVFIPAVTLYDVKPQSIKIPVSAKPSGTSPNHRCQCSLVIPRVIKTHNSESRSQAVRNK